MAKEKLIDSVISEIPSSETRFKEGTLNTIAVIGGKRRRFLYKYVLTDKGVWLKSQKVLWVKSKVTFMPYGDIDHCSHTKYFSTPSFMFYPKSGVRPSNQIVFDDMPGAEEILKKFIRFKDKQ